MKEYYRLFTSFFKIGLFTFGGGYAMLPLLEREVVKKHKWLTMSELVEIMAVAQMVPGTIAINTATFVGFQRKKLLGAICAAVGVVIPSFIIITLIYNFGRGWFDNVYVQKAFMGAKAAVVALVLNSGYKLYKGAEMKGKTPFFLLLLGVILLILGVHPILVILWGILSGALVFGVYPILKEKYSKRSS